MCGRYTLGDVNMDGLGRRFSFTQTRIEWRPSFNIAPTEESLAVVVNKAGEREAVLLRWGLIPFWAKDIKIGASMINAKAETLATKPAFREAFQKRRCLIVADGFFEWRKEGALKLPIRYTLPGGEPFAFAGLWASWRGPDGPVRSCTIVTTEPNELIRPLHDRMPVILSDEAERLWLDQSVQDAQTLVGVLTPFPAGSMKATPVSRAVNSVKNKGPECVASVGSL